MSEQAARGPSPDHVRRSELRVAPELASFLEAALPGTGVDPVAFWAGFSALVHDLIPASTSGDARRVNSLIKQNQVLEVRYNVQHRSSRRSGHPLAGIRPRNVALLQRREDLQAKINAWHIERRGRPHDHEAYKAFLAEIGYLLPEGEPFTIDTTNVDPEIAMVPGPQLVVPIASARFALNAANARWGSLYDGLYGTDAMGSPPPSGGYDRGRGARLWRGRRCSSTGRFRSRAPAMPMHVGTM